MPRSWSFFLIAATVVVFSPIGGRAADAAETLIYTLRPAPESHSLSVSLEWTTSNSRRDSHLEIAEQWASVRQPARFVRDFAARGGRLEAAGESENRWTITHEPNATIVVNYVVDPHQRSFDWDRIYQPITWRRFFHGIGHTFLITPDPERAGDVFDVEVRWDLPAEWTDAVCSFGSGRSVREAITIEDLRHSVFLAGDLDVRSVEVAGSSVTVAMHDLFSFDLDAFTALATEIIAAEIDFMNETAFPHFLITVIPVGDPPARNQSIRRGGTGLFRSFSLFLPPMSILDDDIAFLFAHELFHYWNGRILGRESPEELVYWISEGFTDYYAMRILLGASPRMRASLAARLNEQIRRYRRNEAIAATNNDIKSNFWTNPASFGQLPYQRGMLLAIRWHHLARARGIADGIDQLFLDLVDRARRQEYQLSNESVRAIGIEQLGEWFAEEFDRFVEGGDVVSIPRGAMLPHFDDEIVVEYELDLGFDFDQSREAGVARGVRQGAAAAFAGLREGDKLVGWLLHKGDPDREVELNVQRDGGVETIRYLPRGREIEMIQYTAR